VQKRLRDDPHHVELDAFYSALSALAREYQFRDRDSTVVEGLSVTECYTLETLAEGEPMSVNAVAAELRLDKSTASRAISALVVVGLARRTADPHEHRAWRVLLTPKGRAAFERITGRVKQQLRPVLARLDARTRARLTATLAEVALLTRERMRGPVRAPNARSA
jgi:DNA-binding MarR family transcriptional regulator